MSPILYIINYYTKGVNKGGVGGKEGETKTMDNFSAMGINLLVKLK